MNLIILSMVYILSACCREEMPSPCKTPPCDSIVEGDSTLQLLWQKQLRIDGEYTPYNSILITNKHVVFFYDYDEQEKMLFVDKEDTSIKRFFGPNKGSYHDRFYLPEVGIIAIDYLSVFRGTGPNDIKKIASTTTELQYKTRNVLYNDHLYMNVRDDNKGENYIYKINVRTGEQTIDIKVKDSDYPQYDKVSIGAPCFMTLTNGDIIANYSYLFWKGNQAEVISKVENYKTKQVLWTNNSGWINSFQENIITYHDNVISNGNWGLNCLNPYTGDTIWTTPVPVGDRDPRGWGGKNLLLVGNTVSELTQGHFTMFNADNGSVIYDSPLIFSPQSNSELTYFDGVYYWTAAQGGYSWIFGLRASDYKVVLKMKSPNLGKPPYYNDPNYDWNGLNIDPETRLAYTADGFFAQCFRIPEKWE